MTMTDEPPTTTAPKHPARWSLEVLDAIQGVLAEEAARTDGAPLRAWDPFCGVGLAELRTVCPPTWQVGGGELEPEWAAQSPGAVAADACRAPLPDGSIDVLVTSPTYGNRMADTYDGSRDTCRACRGEGCARVVPDGCQELHLRPLSPGAFCPPCETCQGTGHAPSARRTYRIFLGRQLTEGSTADAKWHRGERGARYRALHGRAWTEAWRYLADGALIVINVSNSLETVGPKGQRVRVEHHVTEWHLAAWLRLGARLVATVQVGTRRFSHGQNREHRAAHEWLLVLRKPPAPEPVN